MNGEIDSDFERVCEVRVGKRQITDKYPLHVAQATLKVKERKCNSFWRPTCPRDGLTNLTCCVLKYTCLAILIDLFMAPSKLEV